MRDDRPRGPRIAIEAQRGTGEIFFVPDARGGLGLAVAVTLHDLEQR